MIELLKLETDHFALSIWANNIDKRFNAYQTMLDHREKKERNYKIKFSSLEKPKLSVLQNFNQHSPLVKAGINDNQAELAIPLFFENSEYQFEWQFKQIEGQSAVQNLKILHYLAQVNNAFRCTDDRIIGNLATRNDIGWFTLPIQYDLNNQTFLFSLSFEILPTKIDLHSDTETIYQTIDQEFPLLRFNFGKTEQETSENKIRGNFPLFWLTHFKQLKEELVKNIKLITQMPHQRLQTYQVYRPADKLKGKVNHKRLEQIQEHQKNGLYHKPYMVEQKRLSVNTPENRFVKTVVVKIQSQLKHIAEKLALKQQDYPLFSDHLFQELKAWQAPFAKLERQTFLNNIEVIFNEKSSLVLQQRTGYAKVYRIWQDLKYYLDFFENQKQISMKSISELYEIWCFLTLKDILIEELDFELIQSDKQRLYLRELEYQLGNGDRGSFKFKNKAGVKITLAHEKSFTKKSDPIRTYGVSQKPDIFLEVSLPNKEKHIFLFDAKYRVWTDEESQIDYVPEDAINQMHRYRDALIRAEQQDKSRPVFGGFALYPGFFNQEIDKNPYRGHIDSPYKDMIDQVGIGAFALLPSQDNVGRKWLVDFLKEKLCSTDLPLQESLMVQEPARISYSGMNYHYYQNLVMTIRIGDKRSDEYIEHFRKGTAKYYHTKADIFKADFKQHILNEIKFLAIAYPDENNQWIIDKVYPIEQVETLEREIIQHKLGLTQLGAENLSNEPYYLFKLGIPMRLLNEVKSIPTEQFRLSVKLCELSALQKVVEFGDILGNYRSVLAMK